MPSSQDLLSPIASCPGRQATAGSRGRLAGKRVLVVEDDVLIALDIASELRNAGCVVLGPALRLEAAMTLAEPRELDAAVLDVFLQGAYAWQLAGVLGARRVPFIFQTGFGQFLDIPADFASVPLLDKPLRPGTLRRELAAMLQRSSSGSDHNDANGICL